MVYEHILALYENQLWADVIEVSTIAVGVADNQSRIHPASMDHAAADSSLTDSPTAAASSDIVFSPPPTSGGPAMILSPKQRFHVMLILADALSECNEHKRAEAIYEELLQNRKSLGKSKSSSSSSSSASEDAFSKAANEVEIKFKLHLCYLRTQQPTQALSMLQSITSKQRTAKINMALGKLYHGAGMERPAIACVKEVLKACPMAVEAAKMLMSLGVKAREIQELTLEASSGTSSLQMLFRDSGWIHSYAAFTARDYPKAISGFKQLENRPLLRNDISILVTLGLAQYYGGEYTAAISTLQRVQKLEPNNLKGMDALAALLAREKRVRELESLASRLMSVSEEAPEPWVAMGYYCYMAKKLSKAVYFAHKACLLCHRCVEALLLKGNVLLDLKKVPDAMNHFREALLSAPHRFELHQGMVNCYLAESRYREAVSVADMACKQLTGSSRALTLLASVLIKDPMQMSTPRAKSVLEKALALEPAYLPAVYLLVDLLEQEMALPKAIDLLRKQLTMQSSPRLHQLLGDLLVKAHHDEEGALEHYSLALHLDPKNPDAQEGLRKIENSSENQLEATYDLDMDDTNSEDDDDEDDDDAELEESEGDPVWSEPDLNLTANNGSARFL